MADVGDTMILTENLKTDDGDCVLTLTDKSITWDVNKQKETIQLNIVVAVCKADDENEFTVTYVDNPDLESTSIKLIWKTAEKSFNCPDAEAAKKWIEKIKSGLNSCDIQKQRPKSLLIFISPVSGSGKAQQIYDTYAAPLFKMAEIETDIIVTQKAKHPQEILATYDISKIDGIVAVGGDGIVQECMEGLFKRMAKDKNVDENTKDLVLQQTPIRVGSIAAGSGNGITPIISGAMDPTTCALHILLGFSMPIDIGTIHNDTDGKLLCYMDLIIATGSFADVMADSEGYRYLGPLRYLYCLIKICFWEGFRLIRISADLNLEKTKEDGEKDLKEFEWGKVEGEFYATLGGFILDPSMSTSNKYIGNGCLSGLIFMRPHTIFQLGKFLIRMFKLDPTWRDLDFIESRSNIKEGRLEWGQVNLPDGKTYNDQKDLNVEIDGEIIKVEKPEIYFKVHQQVLQTFGRKIGW